MTGQTASGAVQTMTSQDITQQSHKLQPYSKLAVTEHTLLYMVAAQSVQELLDCTTYLVPVKLIIRNLKLSIAVQCG